MNKRVLVDVFVVAFLLVIGIYNTIALLQEKNSTLVEWLLLGLNAGMVFLILRAIWRRWKVQPIDQEEAYERYCTQLVNGQMTEYPNVEKQQCFRSIAAAMGWAVGTKNDSQSYRIVDLADGSIVILNGKEIQKREKGGERYGPPTPYY